MVFPSTELPVIYLLHIRVFFPLKGCVTHPSKRMCVVICSVISVHVWFRVCVCVCVCVCVWVPIAV